MSKDPSKTLDLLFAIEPQLITHDLRRAEDDIRSIADEIASVQAIPFDAKTPQIEARRAHLFMIQAHELCRRDSIAPEVQTFYAAFGAGHIAQDAEMVAADRDTCAELSRQMDAIRRREGLATDEFWAMQGEGPQDYRDLSDEFGRVLERITDTVFVFALRRYHLNDQADLFERDRVTFEIQREIGRRVIMPLKNDEEVGKMMDDYFRREYGTTAFERVLARVQEIRENVA
jgi:hypothetical protein